MNVADGGNSSNASGHRARLRERFLRAGPAALNDEALLELLLTYAIPQRDVKPLARSLLSAFGNLSAVLAADPSALSKVSGVKETSITLLKLAQHLRQGLATPAPTTPPATPKPTLATADTLRTTQQLVERGLDVPLSPPRGEGRGEVAPSAQPSTLNPQPSPVAPKPSESGRAPGDRKLQVSNGYLLEAAQLARLLTFVQSQPQARKIPSAALVEGSGLSTRQVENLVSMASALGLITPRTQILTRFGKLVALHDIFLDGLTTLEYSHFLAAGNQRHLVWFEVFNDLLPTQPPMAQTGWSTWLRQKLAGQFSEASLRKHVAHEVRFILDAYLQRNFKKLNLLSETPEHTFAVRRYSGLQLLSLAAMIYALGERSPARLVSFADLSAQPGSPGRIFALDAATLRQMVESLHQREYLRFEVRHGLDQLRLLEGLHPLEFLAAAYENRAPKPSANPVEPAATRLLL